MLNASQDEIIRALSDRVSRRVIGKGIGRRSVEDAVRRVVKAIERSDAEVAATLGTTEGVSDTANELATITGLSFPDLGSRIRRDLEAEGVVIQEMGLGTAGRYTVVTLRLPTNARPVLTRLAHRLNVSLAFVGPTEVGAMTT